MYSVAFTLVHLHCWNIWKSWGFVVETHTVQLPDRVESVVLQRVCTGALPVCAAPPGLYSE